MDHPFIHWFTRTTFHSNIQWCDVKVFIFVFFLFVSFHFILFFQFHFISFFLPNPYTHTLVLYSIHIFHSRLFGHHFGQFLMHTHTWRPTISWASTTNWGWKEIENSDSASIELKEKSEFETKGVAVFEWKILSLSILWNHYFKMKKKILFDSFAKFFLKKVISMNRKFQEKNCLPR